MGKDGEGKGVEPVREGWGREEKKGKWPEEERRLGEEKRGGGERPHF